MFDFLSRLLSTGPSRKSARRSVRHRPSSKLHFERLERRDLLASIVIDDFDQAQSLTATGAPPQTTSGFVNDPGILGGQRDAIVSKTLGSNALNADFSVFGGSNIGYYSDDFGVDGSLQIAWDGMDNNPTSIDKTGLSAVNLAQNTTGFDIVASSDLGATFQITVYSGATGASVGSDSQVLVGNPAGNFTSLRFNYSAFSGVDFSQVGAIVLTITPTSPSADITMELVDASGNPQADVAVNKTVDNATPRQGQSFNYTVTAQNLGPDLATGVTVNDLLPAGLTINSITPTAGTSYNQVTGVWTVGNIASGASDTLIVNATIPVGSNTETFSNTASLGTVDQGGDVLGNDFSTATVTVARDFGDAPTSGQTTGANAARHALLLNPTLYLGTIAPDAEADGQPNASATGDNNNGIDDEDGFNPAAVTLLPGQTVNISVNVTGSGRLDAFIDFDHSGTFDASERITPIGGQAVTTGANTVTFTVPAGAVTGDTYARFRVSSAGGLGPTGFANDGEVEDYRVTISSLASVGDKVFLDSNANGIQDAGENGVNGVTVQLLDASNNVISTTTTAGGGLYNFANLSPGTYSVHVVTPSGYNISPQNQGSDDTLDSDINPLTGSTAQFTLTSGQNDTTQDAGLYQLASVGNFVFQDLNGNGIQDAGETGLNGVTVNLLNGSGTVVASTTTAGGGMYSFANLVPGTYAVNFVLPSGYTFSPQGQGGNSALDSDPNPATGRTANFNLTSGQNDTSRDAGVFNGATVGNFVFQDSNDNGIQDAGENGLNGVTVNLFNGSGAVIATTTTAGGGLYSFTNVVAGTYSLGFVLPSGCTYSPQGQGGNAALDSDPNPATGHTANFTLTAGQNDTSRDAGLFNGASIGDFVFQDTNDNGIQDAGETGLNGVIVHLHNSSGTVIATTTTAGGGLYSFANLVAGTYSVDFVLPSGFTFSPQGQGGNAALDSDPVAATGRTANFTLIAGQNDTSRDAGMFSGASVGNFVFQDLNNNGIQDAGETGLNGVTVHLHNSSGTVIATTTTAGGGLYNFANLVPGTYSVDFVLPTGYVFSPQGQGGNAALDSDPIAATGRTANFNLISGQNDTSHDAGLFNGATVGDFVFQDLNGNGKQDAGELGVANATVKLFTSTGTLVGTTTSSSAGAYQFTGITPGNYYLQFDPSTIVGGGVLTKKGPTGTKDPLDSDPDPTTGKTEVFALAHTEIDNSWDAGILAPASVSGQVFLDDNRDGILQAGEPGIAGVTIAVTGTNDLSQNVSLTTITNASGNYSFTNLRPGTYILHETQPAKYTDGKETLGSAGGVTTNDQFSKIVLTAGTAAIDYLFGELGAAIQGRVFKDGNRDGVLNGTDSGIANVTVALKDASNNPVASTTTAADGSYQFTNLPTGNYTLVETQPVGYGTTTPNSVAVVLPLAGLTNRNFGESTSTLSGSVFADTNNDGVRNTTEKGISGATIQLTGTDANGQIVNLSTKSAADGTYTFSGLLSGTYQLNESQPSGYLDGKDALGNRGGILTNDQAAGIVLGAGVDGTGYTFGELTPANVSGQIFNDLNGNGKVDHGDAGLTGITVNLVGTNDLGAPVNLTAVTDSNGTFVFTGLRPGTYQLVRVQPNGYTATKNAAGTAGGIAGTNSIGTFTLGFGQSGINYFFGEIAPKGVC